MPERLHPLLSRIQSMLNGDDDRTCRSSKPRSVRKTARAKHRVRDDCRGCVPQLRDRAKHPRFHVIATFIILTSYFLLSKMRAYRATGEFFDRGLAASAERK